MTDIEKYCVELDIAYNIVASVHADLCRTTTRGNDIVYDTLELLHKIIKLKERLKDGAEL